MEVILKQDVISLGYKDDIVTVKDGYGRNYLIAQGLAILASPSNRKAADEVQRQRAFKEDKIRKEAEALQKALETVKVRIAAKAATTGRIFGSVTNVQIAEAINDQYHFEIDRKKIHVDGEAVKELGTYKAIVSIYKEIKADIEFEVYEE